MLKKRSHNFLLLSKKEKRNGRMTFVSCNCKAHTSFSLGRKKQPYHVTRFGELDSRLHLKDGLQPMEKYMSTCHLLKILTTSKWPACKTLNWKEMRPARTTASFSCLTCYRFVPLRLLWNVLSEMVGKINIFKRAIKSNIIS